MCSACFYWIWSFSHYMDYVSLWSFLSSSVVASVFGCLFIFAYLIPLLATKTIHPPKSKKKQKDPFPSLLFFFLLNLKTVICMDANGNWTNIRCNFSSTTPRNSKYLIFCKISFTSICCSMPNGQQQPVCYANITYNQNEIKLGTALMETLYEKQINLTQNISPA